jgi:hypothetical protein
MGKKEVTVRVRDLGLAASLVSCDFEILQTSWDTSDRAYFIFKQSEELNSVVNHYWSDTLNVKARRLIENSKMLKSMIYAER